MHHAPLTLGARSVETLASVEFTLPFGRMEAGIAGRTTHVAIEDAVRSFDGRPVLAHAARGDATTIDQVIARVTDETSVRAIFGTRGLRRSLAVFTYTV